MAIVNQSSFKRTVEKRKRVARGYSGSGGNTAGRGDKGQKSRSGVSGIRIFEGGQTPIYRTLPIRGGGYGCYKRDVVAEVALQKLILFASEMGLKKVEKADLIEMGFIKKIDQKVKIIGSSNDKISFDVECDLISKGAMSLFEKNNCKVFLLKSEKDLVTE